MYIQCLFLKQIGVDLFIWLLYQGLLGSISSHFTLLFPLFLCLHLFSFFAWFLTLCHLSHIAYYKPGRNLLCPPVVHEKVKLASFFHTYKY